MFLVELLCDLVYTNYVPVLCQPMLVSYQLCTNYVNSVKSGLIYLHMFTLYVVAIKTIVGLMPKTVSEFFTFEEFMPSSLCFLCESWQIFSHFVCKTHMWGNNSSRVLVGLNSKDKIMAQPKTDPFIKGLLLLTQTDQITNRSN